MNPRNVYPPVPYHVRWQWFAPYHVPGGNWWTTAWTSKKVSIGPYKGKYVAMLFKFNNVTERWDMHTSVGRSARWRAKDQAWRWLCQKEGKPFTSLHTKRPVSEADRFRWLIRHYATMEEAEEGEE